MHIKDGTVSIVSSQIKDNEASSVRAIISKSYPRPPWEGFHNTDTFVPSTLACTECTRGSTLELLPIAPLGWHSHC